MQSFGLWYKKLEGINAHDKKETDASEQVEFSAHINFWFLEDISAIDNKNSIREPYIDIGLKIKNYKCIDSITLHCPFELAEENIEDLSPKMSTKNNATMIFNDDCEIETINSYTCVKFPDGSNLLIFLMDQIIEETYYIEQIDGKSNVVLNFKDFHTYIETLDGLKEIDDLYIRFRIKDVVLKDKIYFDSEPLNKSFESAFSGTRVLDFKINEKRNISERLQAKMVVDGKKWVEFSKIHFLVMEPSSYDLTSFSNYDMSCRELEENMWDDYLNAHIDFTKGHVLAYHWKASGKKGENEEIKRLKDFSCFAKINYSKMRYITLFSYVLMAIALGVLGDSFATLIGAFPEPSTSEWLYQFLGGIGIFGAGWLFGKI